MPENYVLSKRDYLRFVELLHWWERHKNDRPPQRRNRRGGEGGGEPLALIAEVDSDATGGGYYNCHLQTLEATDWDSDTADQIDATGDSVVVANMTEIGTTTTNELVAGDRIMCWYFTDDEGNRRLIGESMEGDIRLANVETTPTTGLLVSVKLLNRSGTGVGSTFNCSLVEVDGATNANSSLPRIVSGNTILVTKSFAGGWIVVTPSIIKSSVCA